MEAGNINTISVLLFWWLKLGCILKLNTFYNNEFLPFCLLNLIPSVLGKGIHPYFCEYSNFWSEMFEIFVESSLALVITFFLNGQQKILSKKGGHFGNCLCFNDSWSITFSGQIDFC